MQNNTITTRCLRALAIGSGLGHQRKCHLIPGALCGACFQLQLWLSHSLSLSLYQLHFGFASSHRRHRRLLSFLRLWNLLDAYANWYLNCCVWHVECVAVAAALNFLFFGRFAHAAHSKAHANANAPHDVSTSACWVLTSAEQALAKWTRAAAEIMMNYLPMEGIQRVVVHCERARALPDRRQTKQIARNVSQHEPMEPPNFCCSFFFRSVVLRLDLKFVFGILRFFFPRCHCLIWGMRLQVSFFFRFVELFLSLSSTLSALIYGCKWCHFRCDADWYLISSRSKNGAALS